MKHIVPVMAVATVLTLGAWTTLSAEEENEQAVKMSDLPAAVQTTIKDKAGSNEIEKIEKKTEKGETVFEAVVKKNGKEWSIEVDTNGKFLKQYEERKENRENDGRRRNCFRSRGNEKRQGVENRSRYQWRHPVEV